MRKDGGRNPGALGSSGSGRWGSRKARYTRGRREAGERTYAVPELGGVVDALLVEFLVLGGVGVGLVVLLALAVRAVRDLVRGNVPVVGYVGHGCRDLRGEGRGGGRTEKEEGSKRRNELEEITRAAFLGIKPLKMRGGRRGAKADNQPIQASANLLLEIPEHTLLPALATE